MLQKKVPGRTNVRGASKKKSCFGKKKPQKKNSFRGDEGSKDLGGGGGLKRYEEEKKIKKRGVWG